MTIAERHPPAHRYFCFLLRLGMNFLFAILLSSMSAQGSGQAPAPSEKQSPLDCAYTNLFLGVGTSSKDLRAGLGITGVTFGQYFARPHGLTPSPQFELGVLGPVAGASRVDGFVSANYMFATIPPRAPAHPFFVAGYTREFLSGNAVNFGLGVDLVKRGHKNLLRLEVRDYYLFTGPRQHQVAFRLGLGRLIPD